MNFPLWMRETLHQKRLTVTECAERANVSQSAWSHWMSQSSSFQPRRLTVLKIAAGLEVSEAEALGAAGYRVEESNIQNIQTEDLTRRLEPIRNRLPSDVHKRFDDYLVKQARDAADLLSAWQLNAS